MSLGESGESHEVIWTSVLLAESFEQPQGEDGPLHLANVGTRAYVTQESGILMTAVLYLQVHFLNARVGDHPVQIDISDRDGRLVFGLDADPISVPHPFYSSELRVKLPGVPIPVGLHCLNVIVDGKLRNAIPVYVVRESPPAHG